MSNELRDGLHFVAGSATWLWVSPTSSALSAARPLTLAVRSIRTRARWYVFSFSKGRFERPRVLTSARTVLQVLSYLRRAHFHPVNIPPPPTPNAHRITQQDLVDSYTQPKIQYLHTGINDD